MPLGYDIPEEIDTNGSQYIKIYGAMTCSLEILEGDPGTTPVSSAARITGWHLSRVEPHFPTREDYRHMRSIGLKYKLSANVSRALPDLFEGTYVSPLVQEVYENTEPQDKCGDYIVCPCPSTDTATEPNASSRC